MFRYMRFVLLLGPVVSVLLLTPPAYGTHPRPKGATPMRLSLVPAYSSCTAPNHTHGAPLAFPSCSPPAQTSTQATVGTPDAFGGTANSIGSVLLSAAPTTPGPPNEADIPITLRLSDVRCVPTGVRCGGGNLSGPADYSGEIRFAFATRLTDHFNSNGTGDAGTVMDPIEIAFAQACMETASTSTGSTCNVNTSVNSFLPGAVQESRAVWEFDAVRVYDGGADGDGDTTGDNTIFARPGVFVP
jgi:hypothetical protein